MATWKPVHDPFREFIEKPHNHKMVWLARQEWPEPQLADWRTANPALNVVGLYWAPAVDGAGPPSIAALSGDKP